MSTLLADSPTAAPPEQSPPDGPVGASPPKPPAAPTPTVEPTCSKCGAPMADGQDWCLQCGASAPGSLGSPSWRPAATILGATAALVLLAAGVAYAALSKGSAKPHVVTARVAQVTPPATTTTPGARTVPTTPGAIVKAKSGLGLGAIKPPKIPLTASVPRQAAKSTTPTSTATGPASTTPSTAPSSSTSGGSSSEESAPASILLDTNAASTYDPYNYPASSFGDPSLAIDGDPSTGWSATVEPTLAPKMAEGLLVDLKAKQKVASVQVITSTPGMTVQVYGARSQTAPPSITDPAWVALSHSTVLKRRRMRLALRHPETAFTFLTLWISRAPASSTPSNPGRVTVNEVELFPAH